MEEGGLEEEVDGITSNLLLELRDDIDGLLQDHELSEWLTITRVQ